MHSPTLRFAPPSPSGCLMMTRQRRSSGF